MRNLFKKGANQKKREFSLISVSIVLFVLITVLPGQLYAQFAGGDGTTETTAYQIETWEHLNNVRDHLDAYFVLIADLDDDTEGYDDFASSSANDGDGWEPIGTLGDSFAGSFDGQDYTISNLFINRQGTSYVALFGYTDSNGTIKSVGLVDVNVTGSWRVGGLVGANAGTVSGCHSTGQVNGSGSHVGGLIGYNSGTVDNSHATASVSGASDYVGGLAGYNNFGLVKNSFSTGEVSGELGTGGLIGGNSSGTVQNSYSTANVSGLNRVGGLVGNNSGSSAQISESYSDGSVEGDAIAGGLTGWNSGIVHNSSSSSEVTGNTRVGGLVGQNMETTSNSFSTGNVSGTNQVGGLIGWNSGEASNTYSTGDVTRTSGNEEAFGGLVGHNRNAIEYSYSTGSVYYFDADDPEDKGFAGGEDFSPEYTGNFFDSEASNQNTDAVGAAEPKTTAEMKQFTTFADWDIAQTDTELNDGYPFLSWQREGGSDETSWLIFEEAPLFCGGEGTETDPYLICTADQLNNVRDYMSDYFKLNNDIDLDVAPYNEDAGWEPIGNNNRPFRGYFDGNGNVVKKLYINRESTNYIGLFGYASNAVISNIGIEGVEITGRSRVGVLVGKKVGGTITSSYVESDTEIMGEWYVGGIAGRVQDAAISDSYSIINLRSNEYIVGGLVGDMRNSTIENSYFSGDIVAFGQSYSGYAGGLVGEMRDVTIINSSAEGSVTGTDKNIGGLVGYARDSSILSCNADVTVTGSRSVGGLIGELRDGTIENSYAKGYVSGQQNAGGLAGINRGTISASYASGNVEVKDPEEFTVQLGGLIGYNMGPVYNSYSVGDVAGGADGDYIGGLAGGNEDTITKSYATGEVTGRDYLGGLVGGQWGTIVASYYDKETTGLDDDGVGEGEDAGITGLTTTEMTDITIFSDVWDIAPTGTELNDGYPFLAWQDGSDEAIWLIFDEDLQVSVEDTENGGGERPAEVALRQNYPNPFNPATIITYELPELMHVQLDLYDMTGRHIAALVNEQVNAGIHEISFDASGLSSGVYIYRLQAGGKLLIRQLTFIK